MYKPHVGYQPPDDENAPIWRYVDFARFMAMLQSSTLWFARLDKMEDQYEGVMPKGQADTLLRAFDALAVGRPMFKAKVDSARNRLEPEYAIDSRRSVYVNCWHLSDYESGAMWKIYSENAIAIRSTFARFRDSFNVEPDSDIWIGTMRYVDFDSPAELLHLNIGGGLYKRKMYDFEKEIRAVIYRKPPEPKGGTPGLDVKIALDTLIESVFIGPGRSKWFVSLVKDMLELFELGEKPVQRSGMDGKPLYLA